MAAMSALQQSSAYLTRTSGVTTVDRGTTLRAAGGVAGDRRTTVVEVTGAHDVIATGLRAILSGDPGVELVDRGSVGGSGTDVVLYDVIGLESDGAGEFRRLTNRQGCAVVLVRRDLRPDLAARAFAYGVAGSVSLEDDAAEILETVHAAARGELERRRDSRPAPGWQANLSRRETEVLAGIAQGLSNVEVAELLMLSPNSIKSYIRSAYRKIGVTRRSQAVAWGLMHGFAPAVP
jgi:DNA-binding NarL/FixJ family response regulator